uniref:Putative squalene-associated FAD-dependent desa n=1 Tax=Magnetococcus massalia (strain MO-1) TaxID=451514 RepID=A0A1S7LK31_MAGMO|nr:Putative squalene-associated FAD-dependent desa [Candidatus Magnetococcus massalia]
MHAETVSQLKQQLSRCDGLILGGGLAGLAAARQWIKQGGRPLVLEAAPQLGGRASSHWDRHWGVSLDNGPHLLVGAYHQTLAWLDELHPEPPLLAGSGYHFHTAQDGFYSLTPGAGPAPWRLLRALSRFPGVETKDLLSLARLAPGLFSPRLRGGEGRSVTEWLQQVGVTPTLFERLWEPLTLATLNEGPGSADATLFAEVVKRLFLAPKADGLPLYPTTDLQQLLIEPAARWIRQRGGEILTHCRIQQLKSDREGITALFLHGRRGGGVEEIALPAGVAVISSLPQRALRRLMPQWQQLKAMESWLESPIVAVHLRYPCPVPMPAPMVGLPGGVSQWLCQWPDGHDHARRVSASISGAYREVSWSTEQLVARVRQELEQLFPSLAGVTPQNRVIKNRRATFAAWPGCQQWRRPPATPWPNLFLAGDWTATPLPATLEGAVLSGQQAARAAFHMV